MTGEELLSRLRVKPVPATDIDGKEIAEFAGLYFKPLDCDDMLAVSEYGASHGGPEHNWRMVIVRALVLPPTEGQTENFARVLTEAQAEQLGASMQSPIQRAVSKIREISHIEDDEKKVSPTLSTNGKTEHSSSALPVT